VNPPPWLYIITMAPFIGAIGTASTGFFFIPYNLLKGYEVLDGTGLVVNGVCAGVSGLALGVLVLFWREFLRQPWFVQFGIAVLCWFLTFAFWLLFIEVLP